MVPWQTEGVAELGSGDARAIAHVVRAVPGLTVHGTDISADLGRAAPGAPSPASASPTGTPSSSVTSSPGPTSPEGRRTSTVIANPPYIPAPDGDILMPELWGGWYGNDLVLRLLKAGFDHLLVALPSYSDPAATLAAAGEQGYRVANFLAMGLEFGAVQPRSRRSPSTSPGSPPRATAGPARAPTSSRSPCSPARPRCRATGRPSCSGRCS